MENQNNSNSNHHFEKTLKNWITDEKAATEFINVIAKLWFDKSVELILFRRQLLERSASSILSKHSYAETIIKKPLKIQDSLLLAEAMLHTDLAPSRIDIGRLNKEWIEEQETYKDVNDFLKSKLHYIVGAVPRSSKVQDVVLYGFGRIGRLAARQLINSSGNGSQLRLRAVVTRSSSPEDIRKRASLFRKDSVHGRFNGIAVENIDDETLHVNGHVINMISAKNPEDIDYTAYGINDALLIDNTGVFRDRINLSRHLKSKGISKVLLTAPGKGDIPNVVYGVNQDTLDLEKETIYSAASCTTNAVVPVLSVIENEIGIIRGHIETIHSYTNDQNLLDNYHKKSRRGRAAALNMVITETGAATAAVKAVPSLKGKLTANSVRVPTPNVSLAILSLNVNREVGRDEVNEILKKASLKGTLIEQIRYSASSELVSTDCIGDSCACIFDSAATLVSDDNRNIVLYLWYDNEFGYTSQVMRLAKHIGQVKSYRYY
jgi:glyceraldehyde 3-phosphate dehydrogenase